RSGEALPRNAPGDHGGTAREPTRRRDGHTAWRPATDRPGVRKGWPAGGARFGLDDRHVRRGRQPRALPQETRRDRRRAPGSPDRLRGSRRGAGDDDPLGPRASDAALPRMKPPRFLYACPHSLDEALALVAAHGDAGKLLAGGQSLVPILNMRLAEPKVLIDL